MTFVTLSPGLASELTGQASTIDGDTLEIHGTRIRLFGIDAPESSQLCRADDSLPYRCGAKAANELDRFIAGRPVSCEPMSRDVYGRTVATCSVGSVDLAEWLVRGGLAFDWPRYSKGKYDDAQREANHAGRGVWAGSYVVPWLYRACKFLFLRHRRGHTRRLTTDTISDSSYKLARWKTTKFATS